MTTATLGLRRLPYASMQAFPALFTTYCTDYSRVAAYYAGDWRDPDARRTAADRAAAHVRDRDTLADVLLAQNERWGLDDATRAHIEALRDPASVAVVTGQQVGLFTGALYTPLKTITALQLARTLAEETDRPVVPVFWLEGGDHDLAEVTSTHFLRGNEVETVRYTGHVLPEDGNLGPVGRLALTEQITGVLNALEDLLPPSDFRPALMERLRAAYQPGTTFTDAFARTMRGLFPDAGLVFIDPDDARLKRLAAPLFRREVEDHPASLARLQEVSAQLEKDFHAQVHPRSTNLFLLEAGGRYPLDATGGGFAVRGTDQVYTQDELLALIEAETDRFSPNVVLRPLMQDVLLPTAAYIGGPGEVSYFAQFKPIYHWAGVPMPIVYPRASVTLVESKVQKVLDRYDLTVDAFSEDLEQLFQRVVKQEMSVDVDAVFKDAATHLHQAINELKPQLEQVDRTLVKAAEATRAAFLKEWNQFKGRVVKAEKRNQEVVHDKLEKAQVNLFPDGLQERTLSVFYFLNKYGPALLETLEHTLALDTAEHQVVEL